MKSLKAVGYYISKSGRACKAYKLWNNKKRRYSRSYVNSKKESIKGKKIYKTKKQVLEKIKKMKSKRTTSKKPTSKKTKSKKVKFGKTCHYEVPYFGAGVPSISKYQSGTPATGHSSIAWMWPTPIGAKGYDTQQGSWKKY
jgi:hypothetical protein